METTSSIRYRSVIDTKDNSAWLPWNRFMNDIAKLLRDKKSVVYDWTTGVFFNNFKCALGQMAFKKKVYFTFFLPYNLHALIQINSESNINDFLLFINFSLALLNLLHFSSTVIRLNGSNLSIISLRIFHHNLSVHLFFAMLLLKSIFSNFISISNHLIISISNHF